MILLSLPFSEAASPRDKSAQAARRRKPHLIRPISTAGAPAAGELRGALVQCKAFLSAKGRVCVCVRDLRPGRRSLLRSLPPNLLRAGGEGKTPQDPPARPPNCSESSANTSPRGAGKHRWKKGSGGCEPSCEPEREGRRSSRGRVFAAGGWSQWRADVSVAGAARGLRACARNSPRASAGCSEPLFKRVSGRVSVCGGEGAGGGSPCPGAGPAQPIWGRPDVRGAPGAGRGPGRGQVPAGPGAASEIPV